MPKNLAIVDAVSEVAARHGVSNAQIALAWLLAQGDDIVPIPGVKRSETMRDSVGAPEVTLSEEDLATIAEAAPNGAAAGPRYNAAGMARVKL
jgi:aryl-alcohol dehydrogenase-like predicted oxidoreductase